VLLNAHRRRVLQPTTNDDAFVDVRACFFSHSRSLSLSLSLSIFCFERKKQAANSSFYSSFHFIYLLIAS
jgi:hypothetical protein